MSRTKKSSILDLYMNGEKVGKLGRSSTGKLELIYDDEWIESKRSRSISLSLPIIQKRHTGDIVEHFFDNLLPDSLPIYDVISAYPIVAKKQYAKQKLKMAMAVRGKSVHYEWDKIQLRHWISTAKLCHFPESEMSEIIDSTFSSIEAVINSVSSKLPQGFSLETSEPIFTYLRNMAKN